MVNIIVTAARGLDELLKQEICQLLTLDEDASAKLKLQPGQVSLQATIEDAYYLCMCSRLANRVLLVLNSGVVNDAEQLYKLGAQVDWTQHFTSNNTFSVQFVGTNRAINNSQFGALKVKDAIVDSFVDDGQSRPNVDRQFPDIQVHVRLRREKCVVCLDLSGQSLHQRGYRQSAGDAPLKEQLAAALLFRSGWHANQDKVLLDPMCGSGTIAIEAALMASNIAPNVARHNWGFNKWLGHNQDTFEQVKARVKGEQREPSAKIYASDLSHKVLDIAIENAELAGVSDYIEFKQCDAVGVNSPASEGYIVSNPPYGERLGDYVSLLTLFSSLGEHLKTHFANWHVALLCSEQKLLKALKLRSYKRFKLFNGKLETELACYELTQDNQRSFTQKDAASDFDNRLAKNKKRLQNWLKRSNTNAYRVYDADLPNYNFAIDCYGEHVIVQEYAAPKNVPEQVAQDRLAQALLHLPELLQVKRQNIVLKTREKQSGSKQYQALASSRKRVKVEENHAQFWINPYDYLDVGLFLDHRITRKMFAQDCKDKHVLNLFCYTGSASVHAARCGASSVCSVDMSKTYIEWAKDNFTLNALSGNYSFIQQDCLAWLKSANVKQAFDRIFLDPPSFSNSKRMQDTFDVQRDHVALLTDAKRLLAPQGKVYFSNNLRTFSLDEEAVKALGFEIKDITASTVDEDFKRRPKMHQCWILQA